MLRTILFLTLTVLTLTVNAPLGHSADFTLIFSNDIRGEIEPCG